MKAVIMLLGLPAISAIAVAGTTEEKVQAVRLIGQVLAEYTEKKGATPYAENWKDDDPDDDSVPVTIICNLSEKEIPDRLAFPPFSCHVMEAKELEAYLSKGLGRKVVLPKDDRELNAGGRPLPLFYTIQIGEGEFFVATYLTEEHKDARKLGEKFYKFEVGSVAVPEKKIEKATVPGRK